MRDEREDKIIRERVTSNDASVRKESNSNPTPFDKEDFTSLLNAAAKTQKPNDQTSRDEYDENSSA
jgi:hypothetical protein